VGTESWLDVSSHNVGVAALSIKDPDCHGFLTKVGNHCRTWRRRYCVLKNACLYYYRDASSGIAKGLYDIRFHAMPAFSLSHFFFVVSIDNQRRFDLRHAVPSCLRAKFTSVTIL
jgi:PH domain